MHPKEVPTLKKKFKVFNLKNSLFQSAEIQENDALTETAANEYWPETSSGRLNPGLNPTKNISDNFQFREKSQKVLNPQFFSEKNFKNWIQVVGAVCWADF